VAGSAVAGSAVAGSAVAGSAVAGSAVAGSAVAGSAVAGSAVAGSAVAGSAVAGSAVAGSAVAGSAVAGSAVAEVGSAMDGVWRRNCERKRLLSAHASLLLLSRARLLSLAWRPGLRLAGGAAVLGAGVGGIMRMMVSFSRPSRVS
jgi:hypothetical protein